MKRLAVIVVMALGVAACGSDNSNAPAAVAENRSATDRLAMSELRNAFAAETVYFTDNQTYTESLDELRAIEPSLTYAVGTQPVQERTTYIRAAGEQLHLSARSASGRCFYMHDAGGQAEYAVDTACGPAEGQQYAASW